NFAMVSIWWHSHSPRSVPAKHPELRGGQQIVVNTPPLNSPRESGRDEIEQHHPGDQRRQAPIAGAVTGEARRLFREEVARDDAPAAVPGDSFSQDFHKDARE